MRTLGVIVRGLVVVGAVAATAVAVTSVPDIMHYRRLRTM
jgi:hypothetical protein